MFESGNICKTTLLQNPRAHRPRGIIKTMEKPILHRTQVLYFCSGKNDRDIYLNVRCLGPPELVTDRHRLAQCHGVRMAFHKIKIVCIVFLGRVVCTDLIWLKCVFFLLHTTILSIKPGREFGSIWIDLGPFFCPTWPIGPNLSSSWVQHSAIWSQVGPFYRHGRRKGQGRPTKGLGMKSRSYRKAKPCCRPLFDQSSSKAKTS